MKTALPVARDRRLGKKIKYIITQQREKSMDKIKLTQITHLMAQIKGLLSTDDDLICYIDSEHGDISYIHLTREMFKQLFDTYNTRDFGYGKDELYTEINGVEIMCLVNKK